MRGHTQSGVFRTIWSTICKFDGMRDSAGTAWPSPSGQRRFRSIIASRKDWRFSRSAVIHPFTMRESPYLRSLPYQLLPVLGVALVLAVLGPFGTYQSMDLVQRLAHFGIIGALSWIQVVLLAAWFGTIEPIDRWPVAGRMTLVGLLAAIPSTFEVIAVHSWLVRPMPLSLAPQLYPENAFLTVVISVMIGLFVEQRLRAKADAERERVAALPLPATPEPGAAPPAAPDFLRRVPLQRWAAICSRSKWRIITCVFTRHSAAT
jgi:hypothetical protein